jgi:hypothetical protein
MITLPFPEHNVVYVLYEIRMYCTLQKVPLPVIYIKLYLYLYILQLGQDF